MVLSANFVERDIKIHQKDANVENKSFLRFFLNLLVEKSKWKMIKMMTTAHKQYRETDID